MEPNIAPLLRKGDYICGSFVKASNTSGFINDSNPGDRTDQIGRYPFSLQNAKEAILFAEESQKEWKNSPLKQRMEVVSHYQEQLEERSKILSATLSREIGIPAWEAKQEVASAYKVIDNLISIANRIHNESHQEVVTDALSKTMTNIEVQLQSLGVVCMLTPFSQPLLVSTLFSCASLLMGNSVVHKPSKYSPGVGQAVADLWDRCKLPRGVYNMVQGPGSHIGKYLISHPKVHATLFAGGYNTATEILHNKPPAPHHNFIGVYGGKSSAIVLDQPEDAIENTVREVLSGAVRYTGQRPGSISRVFIVKEMVDMLIDTLAESLDQIKVGYGTEKESFLGPMISEHWRNRYHRYGHTLYSNGHTPIRPVENLDNKYKGYYVRPALYKVNWTNGSTMVDEDPPGPIILVYEVKDFAEAIQLHNKISFRRQVSVFGDVDSLHNNDLAQLDCGAIFFNQAPRDTGLPIGLFGTTGNIANGGSDILYHLFHKKFHFHLHVQ